RRDRSGHHRSWPRARRRPCHHAGYILVAHRASIILAAARNNVPVVYFQSEYARDGGLLSYGVDSVDLYRRAAFYVGGILPGAKPAELPVQLPTKIRDGRQPEDRQVARSDGAAIDLAARRRGDRIEISQRKTIGRPKGAMGHSLPIDLDGNVRFGQQRT